MGKVRIRSIPYGHYLSMKSDGDLCAQVNWLVVIYDICITGYRRSTIKYNLYLVIGEIKVKLPRKNRNLKIRDFV